MHLSMIIKYLEKWSYQLSFQKYENKSLKHFNKIKKIFNTHVENKSKV